MMWRKGVERVSMDVIPNAYGCFFAGFGCAGDGFWMCLMACHSVMEGVTAVMRDVTMGLRT